MVWPAPLVSVAASESVCDDCIICLCAGLNVWMVRFGSGALGESDCNDQLLALVLFPCWAEPALVCSVAGYAEDIWCRRRQDIFDECAGSCDLYASLKDCASLYGRAATQVPFGFSPLSLVSVLIINIFYCFA